MVGPASSAPSSPVRFLIGGAQKCGTTALAHYLDLHPGIEMARGKEAHFFNREVGVDWRCPDYGPLHELFGDDAGQEVIRGEATPVSLYWTSAHARIFRYNPEMRFILLFRCPVERAWSHWRMIRDRGREPLGFSEAIRSGRLRVLEDPEAPMGLARRFSYVERGFYGRQLRHLLGYFPSDQMLFLRQEDLRHDPDAVLERIAEFLDLAPFGSVTPVQKNSSSPMGSDGMSEEDRLYLEQAFRDDQALFRTLTGLQG